MSEQISITDEICAKLRVIDTSYLLKDYIFEYLNLNIPWIKEFEISPFYVFVELSLIIAINVKIKIKL